MTWATGVAEVVANSARGITVTCPHFHGMHDHARSSVGSNHVVAGCHRGYSQCREYRIVDMGGAGRGGKR